MYVSSEIYDSNSSCSVPSHASSNSVVGHCCECCPTIHEFSSVQSRVLAMVVQQLTIVGAEKQQWK
jgi:hypothetical protein